MPFPKGHPRRFLFAPCRTRQSIPPIFVHGHPAAVQVFLRSLVAPQDFGELSRVAWRRRIHARPLAVVICVYLRSSAVGFPVRVHSRLNTSRRSDIFDLRSAVVGRSLLEKFRMPYRLKVPAKLSQAVLYVQPDCCRDGLVNLARGSASESCSDWCSRTDQPSFWFSLGQIRESNRNAHSQSIHPHHNPAPTPG